jgi:hypothetical protein
MQGDETFTVRGIMKPGGLASAFGGNLAIMDVYSAQKVFGRGRKFDRVDIALQEGLTLEQGIAGVAANPRSGISDRAAQHARPAVRSHLAHLLAGVEHHQCVRAVHRDVHHLQHLRDRRDAAAQ